MEVGEVSHGSPSSPPPVRRSRANAASPDLLTDRPEPPIRLGTPPKSVKALGADRDATMGAIRYTTRGDKAKWLLDVMVARVDISTLLVIE